MGTEFRRHVLVSIATIAMSFGIFGAALVWLGSDVRAQAARVRDVRLEIQAEANIRETLAELRDFAPTIEKYQGIMDALLPSKDDLLDFPRSLDGIARANRTTLNFAFRGSLTEPTGAEPGAAGFSIDASGPPQNVRDFLRAVEIQSPRFLLSIDSFDMASGDATDRVIAQGRVFFR